MSPHQDDERSNFDPSEFFQRRDSTGERAFLLGVGGNEDNDSFFQLLYDYHRVGGFTCIILSQGSFLIRSLFTILFTTFITVCVNWTSLQQPSNQSPLCSPCRWKETSMLCKLFVTVFLIWWVWSAWKAAKLVRQMSRIKRAWEGKLGLPSDVRFVDWPLVMTRYRERIDHQADIHYIVNRIMRWDNYFIAILTKNVLDLENHRGIVFTKLLEWYIRISVKFALFRDDGILIQDVMLFARRHEYEDRLRLIFRRTGILALFSAPFVLIAFVVYFAFRHFSEYHKNPRTMAAHCFTPLARWKLRNFNELPHSYLQRLYSCHPSVLNFMAQFASEELAILVKCVSFLLGSMLLILVAIALFNAEAELNIMGLEKPILFYTGVVGALFMSLQQDNGIPGAATGGDGIPLGASSPSPFPQPDAAFDDLVQTLRCMPYTWKSMTTRERYLEIKGLFRYKWEVFLPELLSVVTLPLILFSHCPTRAEQMISFFRENSIHVHRLGIVCSSAVFDTGPKRMIAVEDGVTDGGLTNKMQASMANFAQAYPLWKQPHVPDAPPSDIHLPQQHRSYSSTEYTSPRTSMYAEGLDSVIFDDNLPFAIHSGS